MPDVRQERDAAQLRSFLKTLEDKGPGKHNVDWVAVEYGLEADDLRRFRDGNDSALAKPIVTMFNAILGRGQDVAGYDIDTSLGYADPSTGGWYGNMLAEENIRQTRMRQFHLIDQTRPEAHSALDAWADLGVTGNVTEDSRYGGGFEPVVYDKNPKAKALMADIANRINTWLLPDSDKCRVFRGMCKYGDQFGALGIGQVNGQNVITQIAPRHARTMVAIRGDKGEVDPAKYWKQVLPGRNEPIATFAEWEVAQFSNAVEWGDIYGQSIFDPCLRSYIQLESMESGMIIRRLERASLRYLWNVDVGGVTGGDDAILDYLEKFMRKQTRIRTVDNVGNFRMQKISNPPDKDIFNPKRDKDSPSSVEPIQGDANLGEIADFEHFRDKWFSGLGVPKSHLGYEDASSKGGINDKHIVFARRVRRMQLKFIHGLNRLYWVSLILRGVDPRSFRWTIFPPALSTRDEMMRGQVAQMAATTAYYMNRAIGMSGKVPSAQFLLRYVCHLDTEVIDDLNLVDVVQQNGAGDMKGDPAQNPKESLALANQIMANPEIQQQKDVLQFMLDEREIAQRKPWAIEAMMRQASSTPLTERSVAHMRREMRISELRAA